MYRALLLLSFAFLFSFCTNNESSTNSESVNTANSESESDADAPAKVKTHFSASHETPYCRLWVVKHAAEVENLDDYKGRWFDLKTDGTFESGQWGEKTNYGHWNIQEGTELLTFMFNTPDKFPSNWKIQGAGGGGRIIWKGNVPGNEKGYQVMLEPETVRPNQ